MTEPAARVVPLPGNAHSDALSLLPWYAVGRLDTIDEARVAAHLDGCAECRDQLELERRFGDAIARQPASTDQGWAAMQARLELDRPVPRRTEPGSTTSHPSPRRGPGTRWMGLGLAAQFAAIAGLGAMLAFPSAVSPPRYVTLAAPVAAPADRLIVIFRPETTEARLRAMLRDIDARVVDGPTAANAYVLEVAGAPCVALAGLRARPEVMLAEPIEPARP